MIQVDIGGHPPFPTGSKQFSGNFGNLLFLAVFRVLNFQSRFEALNDVFWASNLNKYEFVLDLIFIVSSCSPRIDLSNDVSSAPNEDRMQKLHPQEVDVSTTPIGARKPFGFSSSGLGFWILLMLKRPLEPHCNNHLLANASSRHISSQR
jgi:hypothetical protein